MTTWPKQNPVALNAFYGNPDVNRDGMPDSKFVSEQLIKIAVPFTMYYPMEDSKHRIIKRSKKWSALTVHRKFAPTLTKVLTAIPKNFTAEEIAKYELDLCGGVFVFRLKRSGTGPSVHSWGCAFDLSHLINSYQRPYGTVPNMMPMKFVNICKGEGLTWGGLWSNADGMHFQGANI